MPEQRETVQIDPFATGLVYHTFVINGKMLHFHPVHLLLVDLGSGQIGHFTWDEAIEALADKFEEKEKIRKAKEEATATVLASQVQAKEDAKPKAPAVKPEGYKRKKDDPVKPGLSKKASSLKKR